MAGKLSKELTNAFESCKKGPSSLRERPEIDGRRKPKPYLPRPTSRNSCKYLEALAKRRRDSCSGESYRMTTIRKYLANKQ